MHPFTERPRGTANAALALRAQAGVNDAPVEYIAGGTDGWCSSSKSTFADPSGLSASRAFSTTASRPDRRA